MWILVVMMCDVGGCLAMTKPDGSSMTQIYPKEEYCISVGEFTLDLLNEEFPDMPLVDYQCVQWTMT